MVYNVRQPPEKDIQWSDTGVAAANKFYKKFGTLIILHFKEFQKTDPNLENKLN